MEPILYETSDYEKEAQRKKRRRFWIIAIVAIAVIVVVAYLALLVPFLFQDNDSATSTWKDKNIPLYTNEIFQTRTHSTRLDPKTQQPVFYYEKRVYLSDDREQVIEGFFQQQLPSSGWVPNSPSTTLDPNRGLLAAKGIYKRGSNETLTIELAIYGQRTLISLTYSQVTS
jgi:hypothetical protein